MAGICLFGMKEEPYGYWPDGKEILELQEENSRLKMLSEADGLTGL